MSDELPPLPPKQDPETLVLRARPGPVVRFRRGLIVASTAAVTIALVGVTWMALEPPALRMAAESGSEGPTRSAAPKALEGAPAGYGDVPRLGPPLPGDLGRPILEHQRRTGATEAMPHASPPVANGEVERLRAAEAERQRQAAAEAAARSSGVLVQLARSGAASAPAPAAAVATGDAQGVARASESRGSPPGGASPARLQPAARWSLVPGTIIPASLITGLNSDLPGLVIAQVTEPVRDSATGAAILIPQGARLIGRYDNVVAFGQSRALLSWQRLVLPDGSALALDDLPAADLAGYSGLEDRVDFHTWRLLKGIALSTLLGVGTELSLGGESDLVRVIRESTQQNTARAGDAIVQRNLAVQPTLRVRPGWPVRAIVHRDLVLQPWRG